MSTSSPGCFQLLCRPFVGRPRSVPGRPRSVILDVVFRSTTPEDNVNEVKCSLRFFKGSDAVVIADELYDVVATVLILHILVDLSAHLWHRWSHSAQM